MIVMYGPSYWRHRRAILLEEALATNAKLPFSTWGWLHEGRAARARL